jgi:hypothetical protein
MNQRQKADQNVHYASSKIRNGDINIAEINADKDYFKFGECFQVWTL